MNKNRRKRRKDQVVKRNGEVGKDYVGKQKR